VVTRRTIHRLAAVAPEAYTSFPNLGSGRWESLSAVRNVTVGEIASPIPNNGNEGRGSSLARNDERVMPSTMLHSRGTL
jgi:hypothetical protein